MNSDTTRATLRAHLEMLGWAAIVGASFPVVGLLGPSLPTLSLTALRLLLAAIVVVPLVARTPLRRPTLRSALLYLLMGLCTATLFASMFWAAPRASALSMSALYVSVPLLAYAFGRAWGVERPAGTMLLVLLVGTLGASMLGWAGHADRSSFGFGIGEAVFFIGCIGSALYPALSKWGLGAGLLSPLAGVRTFWSLLAGGALVGTLALAIDSSRALASMTRFDLWVVVYLGVVSTGATFWLAQRAVAVLTPASVTAYGYLTPFASMLVLFVRDPEQIGWRWLPGSLLVLAVIALLLLRRPASPTARLAAPRCEVDPPHPRPLVRPLRRSISSAPR